jgi:hypothetical protein
MTIDLCHKFLGFVVESEEAGYFNPERYDMALDSASMEKFTQDLPVYGTSEVMNESLSPFKRSLDITNATSPAGLITLEDRYEYLTNIMKVGYDNVLQKITYYGIDVINDDELPDRLRSQMIPVTVNKPVAQRLGNDAGKQLIQLYPKVPNAITINYLVRPNQPKFNYTQPDPDGIQVTYVAAGSTHLNWKEADIYKILFRALTILGVNLDNEKVVQYGQLMTAQNP